MKEVVLGLCTQLGIVLDYDKSNLTPKQEAIYLGMRIRTIVLKAFPTQKRIETLQTCLEEFLGQESPLVFMRHRLLGYLNSLIPLVPLGRQPV